MLAAGRMRVWLPMANSVAPVTGPCHWVPTETWVQAAHDIVGLGKVNYGIPRSLVGSWGSLQLVMK